MVWSGLEDALIDRDRLVGLGSVLVLDRLEKHFRNAALTSGLADLNGRPRPRGRSGCGLLLLKVEDKLPGDRISHRAAVPEMRPRTAKNGARVE